jgi:phenylalanyl-tRNA synthetase alpha chain
MTAPDVTELQASLLAEVAAADNLDALEAVRVSALGKKGRITDQMKGLGQLDGEARKEAGQALNRVKDAVQEAITSRQAALDAVALEVRLAHETIDVTLPPRPRPGGYLHPVSQVIEECIAIFGEMGFTVAEGPDIEDDFHNFTALNIPPEHPARQMHDTFYLEGKDGAPQPVLRTHTSPVQIRTMEASKPPIRVIAPGRTYRSDSDAHVPSDRGAGHRRDNPSGAPQGLHHRFLPGLLRYTRPAGALPAEPFPLHRTLDGGRYRLLTRGRRAADR